MITHHHHTNGKLQAQTNTHPFFTCYILQCHANGKFEAPQTTQTTSHKRLTRGTKRCFTNGKIEAPQTTQTTSHNRLTRGTKRCFTNGKFEAPHATLTKVVSQTVNSRHTQTHTYIYIYWVLTKKVAKKIRLYVAQET